MTDQHWNQEDDRTAQAIEDHNNETEAARRTAANAYAQSVDLIDDQQDLINQYRNQGINKMQAVQAYVDGNKKDWEEVQKAIDAIAADEDNDLLTTRRKVIAGGSALALGGIIDFFNFSGTDENCGSGEIFRYGKNDIDIWGLQSHQEQCAAEGIQPPAPGKDEESRVAHHRIRYEGDIVEGVRGDTLGNDVDQLNSLLERYHGVSLDDQLQNYNAELNDIYFTENNTFIIRDERNNAQDEYVEVQNPQWEGLYNDIVDGDIDGK